jgi:uridine phosphorylase
MPAGFELKTKWESWVKAGCLASEMECAALYIVSQILGARAGCVLNVLWNQEREKAGMSNPHCLDTEAAIKTAAEAVRILIERGIQ